MAYTLCFSFLFSEKSFSDTILTYFVPGERAMDLSKVPEGCICQMRWANGERRTSKAVCGGPRPLHRSKPKAPDAETALGASGARGSRVNLGAGAKANAKARFRKRALHRHGKSGGVLWA